MAIFMDVIIAYFIDLVAGDPYWLPHPVRFIGWLVKKYEGLLRRMIGDRPAAVSQGGRFPMTHSDNPSAKVGTRSINGAGISETAETTGSKKAFEKIAGRRRIAGGILMLAVTATTFLAAFLILKIAWLIHPIAYHIVNIYLIYTALATKCLAVEAGKVHEALATSDLAEARKRVGMLVGRETEHLNEGEITRAVIETTAENTVDGIVSPLFYATIGTFFGLGAPLAYAFKAISTLDSMVGYMNDKYVDFGRVSARTDDAANFIPARLSGLLIPFSALLCGLNMKKSFAIMKRDRRNHKSPNCAYPEAAFAGALGIRLGGTNIYFGRPVEKPTIGDPDKEAATEDIKKSVRLMYASSFVSLLLFTGVAVVVFLVLL